MKKRIFPFLLVMLTLCLMNLTVAAHEVPNLEEPGSITFIVEYEGEPVDGGSLTLYPVGTIRENNGDFQFILNENIDAKQTVVESPNDQQLAETLSRRAEEIELEGKTEAIVQGTAVFPDVTAGLYLVVQQEPREGFAALSPFLISMPQYENGVYVNHIKAAPKTEVALGENIILPGLLEPNLPPTGQSDLPQTGQLNWPIPVLAVGGLILFAAGWLLCGKSKKRE